MTSEEFEAQYAEGSGLSVEELHRFGRFAEPCDCGWPQCQGWQMGHQWEDALFYDKLRSTTAAELGYNPIKPEKYREIKGLCDHGARFR